MLRSALTHASDRLSHPDLDPPAFSDVGLIVPAREPPVDVDELRGRQRQDLKTLQAQVRGQDSDDRQCASKP